MQAAGSEARHEGRQVRLQLGVQHRAQHLEDLESVNNRLHAYTLWSCLGVVNIMQSLNANPSVSSEDMEDRACEASGEVPAERPTEDVIR